jgi:hypothetical protein
MSLSSVSVIANALRLRNVGLDSGSTPGAPRARVLGSVPA